MSTIGDRIKNLRNNRQLTQEEVGEYIGTSKQTLYKYETGIISNIPSDKIELLSKLFDVSPSYLMGWEKDIPNIIYLDKAKKIPILGQIACGSPIWCDENLEGYFIADHSIKADFIVKAKGDSMIDVEIYDGDLVFLKKTPDVENGKIAAVLIDDEATLKKVVKANGVIILQPCNNKYDPILLDNDANAMILGEMVGVYHPYNK